MRILLQLGVTVALALALAGLAARRRLALCWSFVPYALAIIVCGNLATLWPARFYNAQFWLFKQTLYDVAKVAIALELAWRVLRAFPGAQRVARRWTTLLLLGTTALIVLGPPRVYLTMPQWQPRILLGIAWLFTLLAVVVLWYRLPVHVWHRALLLGFSAYLLVFTVLLQILRMHGWTPARWVGLADGGAYLMLTCLWAFSAWRLESLPADVSVAHRLGLETP